MADYFGHALVVEVAFDDVPLEPSPSWTDISAYVRDIPSIDRGSADEFSPPSPGTASFVLDNRTRLFDPSHTGGTYYGKLTPNRRIRVTVDGDGLFDGYVTGWPMAFQAAGLDSFVTITAIDLTRRLQNATLERSAYEALVVGDGAAYYWPMQEENTTTNGQYVDIVDGLIAGLMSSAYPALPSSRTTAPIPIALTAPIGAATFMAGNLDAEHDGMHNYGPVLLRADFVPSAPKTVEFWAYAPTRVDDGAVTALVSLGVTTCLRLGISTDGNIHYAYSNLADNLNVNDVDTGVKPPLNRPLHLAAAVDGTDVDIYLNGVSVYSGSLGAGTFSAGAAGVRLGIYLGGLGSTRLASYAASHLAAYDFALTAGQVAAHYIAGITAFGHSYGERGGARIERVLDDIGIPAAFRDIDTGDTVHGNYVPARQPALDYIRSVETAEDGMVFVSADGKVTFRGRQWQWVGSAASALDFADDGTGLVFEDIAVDQATINTLRNAVSASYGTDGYLRVTDTASIDAYEEVSESLSIPTVDSASTARGLAEYRLAAWKDPSTRVTQLVVNPRVVPDVWGVELADRVAVKLTPVGVGSPLELEFLVRGVSHSLPSSGDAESTLYLAPAPVTATDAPYLIVGDATYGVTGAAAGNQIPF